MPAHPLLRGDLGPAVFRENARRCHVTAHFSGSEDQGIAEALRQYLYARLNVDRPGYRPRLPPSNVRGAANRARRFFAFVVAECGHFDLASVDQPLLDRYARSLRNAGLRPIVASHLLQVVFELHELRDYLPTELLSFEPWPGRSPSAVAGYRFVPGENRTPRIPEEIITPLLALSIRYITIYSADILAARAELRQLEAHRDALIAADAPFSPRQRRSRQRERIISLFDQRRHDGRGVPVWTAAHNGILRSDPRTGALTPPINTHAGTLIHEAAHAAGAKHRLDRNFEERFRRDWLVIEEACAELTASFVLADLGIAHHPRPDHAAYVASWLRVMKDDPRAIFTAASKAQQAADWMHAQQADAQQDEARGAA